MAAQTLNGTAQRVHATLSGTTADRATVTGVGVSFVRVTNRAASAALWAKALSASGDADITAGAAGSTFIAPGQTEVVPIVWNASAQAAYVSIVGNANDYSLELIAKDNLPAKAGQWTTAQSINTQTASYSVVAGDVGRLIVMSVATANNLTVPSGLGLAPGQRIDILQQGAGQTTVVASGVTINARPGLKLTGQFSSATLICISTDVFDLVGDLTV
jgi:hypothetical protein